MGTMAAHPAGLPQYKWQSEAPEPQAPVESEAYLRDRIAKPTPKTEKMPMTEDYGDAFHFDKTSVARKS